MQRPAFTRIKGAVTAARGYRAAGLAAGIKAAGRKDMALIVADTPATAAAVYTTNKVRAAPVRWNQRHVGGVARAIVVNSGNANACTGAIGMVHAQAMATAVARRIGCPPEHVFVCSTGRIGVRLPIVKIEAGIKKLLGSLEPTAGSIAAQAIMTTDTFPKEVAVRLKAGGTAIHVGGIAKGAGMIHPRMATMLSFVTTDARLTPATARRALTTAVRESFNRITVDGDTSTNDTVILLANGAAGGAPLAGQALHQFQEALNFICRELAQMIVRDGEGVSRFVTVNVHGGATERDAEIAARAVANSVLVKTSWCGGDPNWGRIMDALGYSAARIQEDRVEIAYDGVVAVRKGLAAKVSAARLKAIVARPMFAIDIHLHLGPGRCTLWTTDLTEKYVELNKGE
jgi:glutamate N-acetyltransferase / amino-acid N-acetyltransferase